LNLKIKDYIAVLYAGTLGGWAEDSTEQGGPMNNEPPQ
jgi:hypothetical protein